MLELDGKHTVIQFCTNYFDIIYGAEIRKAARSGMETNDLLVGTATL
jgi:hypothetical protein